MTQQSDQSLKACLMLSELREKMKLRRSFWLESFKRESQFLSLADSRLINTTAEPFESIYHQLFSKVRNESKQALLSTISSDSFQKKIHQQLAQARAHNIKAVCWLSSLYPERLLHISSYPLVLYYRGKMPLQSINQINAVTVVGTRRPSYYGRQVVQKMIADWSDKGLVCVSGMARGIDGLAHKAALDKGALTIAVMANGLDIVYPPEHHRLYEQILESGLALSEHPPGQKPLRQHFPARNRILSGLCQAVVVIEAAEKSGSLITAEFAADQGREVFAVPGTIFSSESKGCNLLIKDGAGMLLSPDDLSAVYDFSELSEAVTPKPDASAANSKPDPSAANSKPTAFSETRVQRNICDPDAIRIKDALRACPLSIITLCAETGLSLSRCAVLLTQMELSGQLIFERGHYSLTE